MDLARAWRFKPHLVPQPVDDDRVLLLNERHDHYVLTGALYAQLAPLLDGTRTGHDIAALLGEEFSTEKVYFALMTLHRNGYLAPADLAVPLEEAAFWFDLGVDAEEASTRLKTTPVGLFAHGVATEDVAAFRAALTDAGLVLANEAEASFAIVMTSDDIDAAVEETARRLRERSMPWALTRHTGAAIWVGPIFGAGDGCLDCVASITAQHQPAAASDRSVAPPPLGHALAAAEFATWIACGGRTPSSVLACDARSLTTMRIPLRRDPACRTCGGA